MTIPIHAFNATLEKGETLCYSCAVVEKENLDIVENALDELEKTRDRLIEKCVLNDGEYRIYFNISFPEHIQREPFQSFLLGPKDLLDYKDKQKVNLMGYNRVLVANGAYLKPAF